MTTGTSGATDETRIRVLFEDRIKAVHAKDADALLSNYAPEVLSFDVVNPLQYAGLDAMRKRVEEWFSGFEGLIGCEFRDLSITADGDVAFCHSLNRVSGTTTGGERIDMWVRSTVCCRKLGGRWMVTHEHTSVPFDTQSGRASLDLEP